MWTTVGHDSAVAGLKRAIAGGRLAHSYLITGPESVGKTTLALDLARAANCLRDAPPCGECRQCERISAELHPDVRLIRLGVARSGRARTLISIDQVREIQREASLRPFEGHRRVFVFEAAGRLSGEAANSLLKTLEEPPDDVILILLAPDAEAVLPTILSRCRQINLRPAPTEAIVELLRGSAQMDEGRIREVAAMAAGRVGWAVRAAEDTSLIQRVWDILDTIETVVAAPITDRFEYAERLASRFSDDREGVYEELKIWLSWWRDAFLTRHQKPEHVTNVSRADAIAAISERLSADSISGAVMTIMRTSYLLERNVAPRLAIEGMMLRLPAV